MWYAHILPFWKAIGKIIQLFLYLPSFSVFNRTHWGFKLAFAFFCSCPKHLLVAAQKSCALFFFALFPCSVRRTLTWLTVHATWSSRSPSPTCRLTIRRWKAPRNLSGSPASSAPPSSRRTVNKTQASTFGSLACWTVFGRHAFTDFNWEFSCAALH